MTNLNAIERIVRLYNGLDSHAKAFVLGELNGVARPAAAKSGIALYASPPKPKGKWSKSAKMGLALRRYWSRMTPAERQKECARRLKLRQSHHE